VNWKISGSVPVLGTLLRNLETPFGGAVHRADETHKVLRSALPFMVCDFQFLSNSHRAYDQITRWCCACIGDPRRKSDQHFGIDCRGESIDAEHQPVFFLPNKHTMFIVHSRVLHTTQWMVVICTAALFMGYCIANNWTMMPCPYRDVPLQLLGIGELWAVTVFCKP
jgi:hypothetical protein